MTGKHMIGRPPFFQGKKHSKKSKEKNRLSHIGKMMENKNPAWIGGIIKQSGYIYIRKPKHPFNQHGYVKRARLIMEQIIGRYLTPKEIMHHINGIKTDDRPENLRLINNRSEHSKIHSKLRTLARANT